MIHTIVDRNSAENHRKITGTFNCKTDNFSEAMIKVFKQDQVLTRATPLEKACSHTMNVESRSHEQNSRQHEKSIAKVSHMVKASNTKDWQKLIFRCFPPKVASMFVDELSKKGRSFS